MAYVCMKPSGHCAKCEHFRFDEDYGAEACMARIDKTPDIDHATMTVYASVRARYKALAAVKTEDELSIDDMRDYIDSEWENCGCGEIGMSGSEAEVYLGHPVDDMTQEEIDEEVSKIQKAYYTSGDIAGASDKEVIDKYHEMTGYKKAS